MNGNYKCCKIEESIDTEKERKLIFATYRKTCILVAYAQKDNRAKETNWEKDEDIQGRSKEERWGERQILSIHGHDLTTDNIYKDAIAVWLSCVCSSWMGLLEPEPNKWFY